MEHPLQDSLALQQALATTPHLAAVEKTVREPVSKDIREYF